MGREKNRERRETEKKQKPPAANTVQVQMRLTRYSRGGVGSHVGAKNDVTPI